MGARESVPKKAAGVLALVDRPVRRLLAQVIRSVRNMTRPTAAPIAPPPGNAE